MAMHQKKTLFIISLLMLVGFILILGSHQSTTQRSDAIRVGAILPITGPQASLGEEIKNALVLATDDHNKNTDSFVELFIEDSENDPIKAVSAYRKLKTQRIPSVISAGDQVSAALSPLAEKDKVILFMTLAASQNIEGEYSFRGFITAKKQAELMATYATNDLNFRRLGLIFIQDIYGESYRDAFVEELDSLNGIAITQEQFGITDTDVKTQVFKTIASKPDAIVVAGFGSAYPLVFKTLRTMGWSGTILTDNSLSIPYFFNAIGRENLKDTYYTTTDFSIDHAASEIMKDFVTSYREQFNTDPSFVAAYAYDSFDLLMNSIERCGHGAEQMKKCLPETHSQGVLGEIGFTDHEMSVPLSVRKVE